MPFCNDVRGEFMECRSTEKRQWIVQNYNVEPVAHIQLLEGQTKHSDAGATIEKDYYIFEAVHKVNGKKEVIQCGMGASRDFLKLLNHEGLPLFNPLHGDGGNDGEHRGDGTGGRRAQETWNPTAKQLYNAIMWLIIAWDAKPGTPLFEFRSDIVKYKRFEPFGWKVKRVNSAIQSGGKGKTLTEIIDGFRQNNDVRDDLCQFDLLIGIINNYTDQDGNPIHMQSYF